MDHLCAWVDRVETWLEGLCVSTESLFQADKALTDLIVRVRAYKAYAWAPGSHTATTSSKSL